MKKIVVFVAILFVIVLFCLSASRLLSVFSITKLSDYDDYNLYEIDIKYDYDLDEIISNLSHDDSSYYESVIDNVLPFIPIKIACPKFGCSSFKMKNSENGHYMMGRNYDFRRSTSAMLVRCHPKNGYASIAFAALDNLKANQPDSSIKTLISSLVSPFACLDGINEKGVSISVLMLGSKPTRQNTGKPCIHTAIAIRMVLDRASTTEEAVQLLEKYDMFASAEGDYHFYICDASGDGRIVEYNPLSEDRNFVVIPTSVVTNFYILLKDSIVNEQNQNLIMRGRDRYDKIDSVLTNQSNHLSEQSGWDALSVSSRPYNPNEITSNTQWSAMYDNSDCSVSISIRRDWDNKFAFKIEK